jgi:hypothetical protein
MVSDPMIGVGCSKSVCTFLNNSPIFVIPFLEVS